ncbi:MAG TPA: glycosyltransferase family 9 protein [Micropepsaceae bacterium]|nr:glycosyltransferase family 9 protein [Micropepsaceae bacterium]
MSRTRILVIKLSALGDVVMALGPMQAIRRHHRDAHITILTTPLYAPFLKEAGVADEVWTEGRPKGIRATLALRRKLRAAKFARVYDLQTSGRSSTYFHLMRPRPPEWSGIARGCSHPHNDPRRDFIHTLERQSGQLADAGIHDVAPPDLSFARSDIARFGLRPPFVLLVPGGSAHRPEKRWPVENFGALASRLSGKGLQPVVLGAGAEMELARAIAAMAPDALSLVDRTSFIDIAALGRAAHAAIGNDTGPMHVLAASGCRSIALFSSASDPALTAPRGRDVVVLQRARLADLTVDEVLAALER